MPFFPETTELPTKEQEIKIAAERIRASINLLLDQMRLTYCNNFQRVWFSKNTYTPAEIIAAFGADGAELFRLSALLRDTIEAARPGTLPADVMSALKPCTFNADGTVTVSE